jgi:type III restriction enzyme
VTTQINVVADPIINSPYEEPREGKEPRKEPGRRLASYFLRVPERAARGRRLDDQAELFDEDLKGNEYLLDLANQLRTRVMEWRARQYQGTTRITRELIEHWRAPDREQPLFFAQLEAAETLIFLVEGPSDLLQGIHVPMDEPGGAAKESGYKAFQRYALKMATGSGKTTVMGMLAAWSILNKVADPQNAAYSDTVLIVCPNVTIRDRLQELDPERDEQSLYRTRELVPAHRMTELRRGEVFVTNWHNLERRETRDVNGQGARVVKRGQAE